ncbi:MAG: HypC/HybG/HupF family hydrogenase formation chaperone [Limnohabitans sp.]|jgi:hydrogenase expression/formation protein HypC|nr:HypC/HybG/HupF family hydrogenase formation chaperone [Limnohabitans sp.]
MCLAVPARVVEILPHQQAWVELEGVRQQVSIELIDDLAVGDYVIVHVGFALERLDPEEAQATLALMASVAWRASSP